MQNAQFNILLFPLRDVTLSESQIDPSPLALAIALGFLLFPYRLSFMPLSFTVSCSP